MVIPGANWNLDKAGSPLTSQRVWMVLNQQAQVRKAGNEHSRNSERVIFQVLQEPGEMVGWVLVGQNLIKMVLTGERICNRW